MQIKPPETSNEIEASELLTALAEGHLEARDWFYIATKSALDDEIAEYSSWLPDDDELQYIVLKEAVCKVHPSESLLLDTISGTKRGFIFYHSILPSFVVRESATHDWLIIHSHIQNITFESNSQLGEIHIRENSQAGNMNIFDNSVVNRIRIEKNSKAGLINICSKGKCGGINIKEYSQSDHIYLEDESQAGDIKVRNNSKAGVLSIRASKARSIGVDKNSETGAIGISGDSQVETLVVTEKSCTGPIIIGDKSKISQLIIRESKSVSIHIVEGVQCDTIKIGKHSHVGRFQIKGGQLKDVIIEESVCSIHLLDAIIAIMRVHNSNIDSLVWRGNTRCELYTTASSINHLQLSYTPLAKDAVLSLSNCSIHIIQLQELLVQGMLILRNIMALADPFTWQPKAGQDVNEIPDTVEMRIHRAHFDFLENLQAGFKKRPLFLIVNSSLGKTEITGSDLEKYRLEYRDSRLMDIFITGTKLPIINIYCPDDQPLPPKELFEQKASIYNQLKRIFDNQGDLVEANQYHSRAIDSQKDLLKLINKEKHQPKWFSLNKLFTVFRRHVRK